MKKKIFVLFLPFAVFAACLIVSVVFLRFISAVHYICPVYLFTGFICPGCGATRALSSLLHFRLLESLRNNPVIIVLCICITACYLQLFCDTFGIKVRIIPENKRILIVPGVLLFTYLIIRNFIPELQPLP